MLLANRKNMIIAKDSWPGVFAYSPDTGECYSADPGDYFWVADDEWVITDSEGNLMRLVVEITTYADIDDKPLLKHHDYGVEINDPGKLDGKELD